MSLKALQERYGLPLSGSMREMEPLLNSTLETLFAHRSVRAFLPQSIEEKTFDALMAAAQSASTSSNLQAWSVVRIENEARKHQLSLLAGDQSSIRECPLFLVWLADLSRFQRLAERHQKEAQALDYFESFLMAVVDAALAAQNCVMAAESLGLGAVYIGGIRNQPDQVADLLKLPPLVFPVFGLALGVPDPERPAAIKPRLPQRAVVFREEYVFEAGREEQAITVYEEALQVFQLSQGMKEMPWSRLVLSRLRNAAALQGRDKLKDILHDHGFVLR